MSYINLSASCVILDRERLTKTLLMMLALLTLLLLRNVNVPKAAMQFSSFFRRFPLTPLSLLCLSVFVVAVVVVVVVYTCRKCMHHLADVRDASTRQRMRKCEQSESEGCTCFCGELARVVANALCCGNAEGHKAARRDGCGRGLHGAGS